MIARAPELKPVERASEAEQRDAPMLKAKREVAFTDRLYDLLLNYQSCKMKIDKSAKVGELDPELSTLYDLIWNAALDPPMYGKRKKKTELQLVKGETNG